MKKILLPLLCMLFIHAHATIWNVSVSNFQFSPATLNVRVGDVIHWTNVSGFHSTTSVNIPAGAAPWDSGAPLTIFDYTITKVGNYTYNCTIHPGSMNGSFTATSPVPVVLSAFNIGTQDNKPIVSWTTATEVNADYFSIRKSTNGTDFSEIARVRATGTTTTVHQYSFIDISATDMKYVYYALAIVDRDGRSELSPIRLYKNASAFSKLIISLSPNPIVAGSTVLLQFNADKEGIMQVKVYDTQGREVYANELSASQGINNGHIHLTSLPPGIYTMNFELGDVHESYKVTKM